MPEAEIGLGRPPRAAGKGRLSTLSGQHATGMHKNPVHWSQRGTEVDRGGTLRHSRGPEASYAGLGRGKSQGFRGHARSSGRGSGLEKLRT